MKFLAKFRSFLTFFILFLASAQFATAQQTELQYPVTFNFNQAPLSTVFAAISQQTGLRFSYNTQLINVNKKVTIQSANQPLDKILPVILPSTVTYKQVGKYIILTVSATEKKEVKETAVHEYQDTLIFMPDDITEYALESPVVKKATTLSEIDVIDLLQEDIIMESDSISLINSADTIFIQNNSVSDNGTLPDTCLTNVVTIKTEKMKKSLVLLIAGLFSSGANVATAQTDQSEQKNKVSDKQETTMASGTVKEEKSIQLSFVYPLGTDGVNSYDNGYRFSFNVLGGNTGKVNGFELSSLYNINKYAVRGAQIAGIVNMTGMVKDNAEESNAVQIAGILNYNQKGISDQIGGIANISEKSGIQIGGITNLTKEKAAVQIGGIANISKESALQIGGIIDISQKAGAQIAGIAGIADTTSVQVSGIVNVASKSSCQIGLLNGTKAGGFQLGLINVRDTTDGVSFGLINIAKKNGLIEWEITGSEIIHIGASFRSGSKALYTIITGGYNFSDDFIAIGCGLGTEFRLSNRFGLNLEGVHYNLYSQHFKNDKYEGLVQIRPTFNFKIANHFKIFAGPTFNLSLIAPDDIKFTAPYSIWNTETSNGRELDAWLGFTAGLRF